MNSVVFRSVVFAAMSVALVGSARADGVWYLQSAGSGLYNKYVVTNLAYWAKSEGGSVGSGKPTVGDELVVLNKRSVRMGTKATTTTCKSLTLGDGTSTNYGQLTHDSGKQTYANDGLFLTGYSQYVANLQSATLEVAGKVTILSTAAEPCGFHQLQEKYTNTTLLVSAAVSGETGTGFVIGRTSSSWNCSTNNTVKFTNLSAYKGSIAVKAGKCQEITEDYFGQKAVLSSWTTTGSLSVSTPGCILETVSATDVLTASSVDLSAGSRLSVTFDADGHCSKVVATDSLTVGNGVQVAFANPPGITGRLAILEGPLGCGLDKESFSLVGVPDWLDAELDVDKTDTTEALVIVLDQGWVRMSVSDNAAKDYAKNDVPYPSAMTNKNSWSDGKVPHGGAIYEVPGGFTLRTPREDGYPQYGFSGNGIVFGGVNSALTLFGKGISIVGSYLVPENATCRLWTGQGVQKADVPVSAQSIVVDGVLTMGAYNTSTLVLDGPLSGGGEVVMEGVDKTSADAGSYEFTDNSAFAGRLRLSVSATLSGTNQTWNVYRETDFGANREAFDYRAVTVEHGGLLVVNPAKGSSANAYDYTVPTNCGFFVNQSADMNVQYGGGNLTWPSSWTLNGVFRKRGSGRLALGGPMKFLTNGGELTDTPTEGRSVFEWEGGNLQPLHCDALNGAQVKLTATSQNGFVKLRLDVDYANADLLKYGIRNTKTDHPFAITATSAFPTLPLDVRFPDEHPEMLEFTVGIMTVSASAAEEIGTLLPVDQLPKRIYRGYRQTPVTVPNADGSVTFGVKFETCGLLLLVK